MTGHNQLHTFTDDDLNIIITATVKRTLMELGLDHTNPIALQRDFAHLRMWRENTEELKQKGLIAVVCGFTVGACALLWTAFRFNLH